MFIIRDVMNCKPGKVGELVKKFSALNPVMVRLGYKPARILTDVSGEPFWTAVFELEAETLNAFRVTWRPPSCPTRKPRPRSPDITSWS
jgi:hypothetical protein